MGSVFKSYVAFLYVMFSKMTPKESKETKRAFPRYHRILTCSLKLSRSIRFIRRKQWRSMITGKQTEENAQNLACGTVTMRLNMGMT